MSGWVILEVAIGLVMIYLIISLLCTTITEWIARIWALRAKTLNDGIFNLINDDQGLWKTILNHPLLLGLSSKSRGNHWWDYMKIGNWEVFAKNEYGPSQIPPATFSQIILDSLMEAGDKTNSGYEMVASIKGNDKVDEQGKSALLLKTACKVVEHLTTKLSSDGELALNVKTQKESIEESARKILLSKQNKELFQAFLTAAKTTTTSWEDTIKEFRSSLEKWFDDSMQRVTGWYKRKTQVIILCLALPICFCLNVDTIGIANSLYSDPTLRESVVAAAEATAQQAATHNSTLPTYADLSNQVTGLNIHLGWTTEQGDRNKKPDTPWGWPTKIFGILITVFAVSLGAPFWFDLLNKLVNLRAAGKIPKKTEETPTIPT